MTCRECGCTDGRACATQRGEIVYVCWWAEDGLCSFCALGQLTEAYQVTVPLIEDVVVAGAVL